MFKSLSMAELIQENTDELESGRDQPHDVEQIYLFVGW